MKDDFRFLKLGLASRLALAGGLFALGAALELVSLRLLLPGLALALAGWIPLALRPATNKPDDQGLEEWRPVSMAEIDRLDDGLRESKKLRKRTSRVFPVVAAFLGLPFLLIALIGSAVAGRFDLVIVVANAAVFLAPALFFGRVRVFLPKDIDMKMPSFRALLSEGLSEGIALAPYIRFDKDPAGRDVPEDLRLMLELKRPPADLVGIQLQAAINNGPNGPVPYLYAVVLTKGSAGPSYAAAAGTKASGYEVEPGAGGEYGTVVIRQKTTGGGYATSEGDCRRLFRICVQLLERIPA